MPTTSIGRGGQRGLWVSSRGSSRGGAARGGGGSARGGGRGALAAAKRPRAAEEGAAPASYRDPDGDSLALVQLTGSKRAKVWAFSGAALGSKGGGKGGALLDIREMFEKEGVAWQLPGKKGITLTLPQAEALFASGDIILSAMRAATVAAAEAAEAAAEASGSGGGGAPEAEAATAREESEPQPTETRAAAEEAAEKAERKRQRKEEKRAKAEE